MELAEIRGSVHRLDKIIGATVRQSIWQLIALIVTLLLAISGGLAYQTTAIDKRIEQLDRSSSTRFDDRKKDRAVREDYDWAFEDFERNITARFEDLKQEVRTQRK